MLSNRAALAGGAVFVDGRAAFELREGVQNWESGIALRVLDTMFFRNFCGSYAGALYVQDVWPLTAELERSEFKHN